MGSSPKPQATRDGVLPATRVATHAPVPATAAPRAQTRTTQVLAGLGNQAILRMQRNLVPGPGRVMPAPVRHQAESAFGEDFGDIRVHDDGAAAAAAVERNARAYTVGRHVVFGAGAFEPGTSSGQRLLAHELAHAVQQRRGGAAPSPMGDAPLERAAHRAAERYAEGRGGVIVEGASGWGMARDPAPLLTGNFGRLSDQDVEREIIVLRSWARNNRGHVDESRVFEQIVQLEAIVLRRDREASTATSAPSAPERTAWPSADSAMSTLEIRRKLGEVDGWLMAHGLPPRRYLTLRVLRERLQALLDHPEQRASSSRRVRAEFDAFVPRSLPPPVRPSLREDDGTSGGERLAPETLEEVEAQSMANLRAMGLAPPAPMTAGEIQSARHHLEAAEQAARADRRNQTAVSSAAVSVPREMRMATEVYRSVVTAAHFVPGVAAARNLWQSVSGRDFISDEELSSQERVDQLVEGVEGLLALVPEIGAIMALSDAVTGRTMFSGRSLGTLERVLSVASVLLPYAPALARGATRQARRALSAASARFRIPPSQIIALLRTLEQVTANQAPIRAALGALERGTRLTTAQAHAVGRLRRLGRARQRVGTRARVASPVRGRTGAEPLVAATPATPAVPAETLAAPARQAETPAASAVRPAVPAVHPDVPAVHPDVPAVHPDMPAAHPDVAVVLDTPVPDLGYVVTGPAGPAPGTIRPGTLRSRGGSIQVLEEAAATRAAAPSRALAESGQEAELLRLLRNTFDVDPEVLQQARRRLALLEYLTPPGQASVLAPVEQQLLNAIDDRLRLYEILEATQRARAAAARPRAVAVGERRPAAPAPSAPAAHIEPPRPAPAVTHAETPRPAPPVAAPAAPVAAPAAPAVAAADAPTALVSPDRAVREMRDALASIEARRTPGVELSVADASEQARMRSAIDRQYIQRRYEQPIDVDQRLFRMQAAESVEAYRERLRGMTAEVERGAMQSDATLGVFDRHQARIRDADRAAELEREIADRQRAWTHTEGRIHGIGVRDMTLRRQLERELRRLEQETSVRRAELNQSLARFRAEPELPRIDAPAVAASTWAPPTGHAWQSDAQQIVEWRTMFEQLRVRDAGNPSLVQQWENTIVEASRQLGEQGARAYMETVHPGARLVFGGPTGASRSGEFDQVWSLPSETPRGAERFIIVEAKGNTGRLGYRLTVGQTHLAQQGTPEYLESILHVMDRSNPPLAARLRRARANAGGLEYLVVQTRIGEITVPAARAPVGWPVPPGTATVTVPAPLNPEIQRYPMPVVPFP